MLVELVVENYAVIERVRVRFHDGLNLLTGETGSGKSMVVDALGLLFGGRASAEMIRTGEERARISGIFELPDDARLRALLEQSGIEFEDHELIVEREILAGGKSRAFAGSRPVTATLLRDLAPLLGDIHGQHDQQRLFDAGAQLEMLDAFARHQQLLAEVADLYRRWRACASELEALDRREQENLRLADLWSFQRREIDAAHLKPGEDAALESERRVLQNVARLQELATAAYESLYDSEGSADARLRQATRRLEELSRIDPALNESRAALQARRNRHPGSFLRRARIPGAARSGPRPSRGNRSAPGADRQTQAQVRRGDRPAFWPFWTTFRPSSRRSRTRASFARRSRRSARCWPHPI